MNLRNCALAVAIGLVTCAAAPAQPARDVRLQVDPPDATLVVDGVSYPPHDGVYRLSPHAFKRISTGTLRAPGFQDLSVPAPLPGGPMLMAPNGLTGYRIRYPWAIPSVCFLGLMAALGLWFRSQRESLPPPPPVFTPIDEPPVAATDPLIGTTFGGYRIYEVLGSGGMATVYRALPVDNSGLTVAVKVIHRHLSSEFRQRFAREIELSMKLNHPNVVRLLDWGEADGLNYLVMELVNGSTLSHSIPKNGLPVGEAMKLLGGVIDGLAYAHSLGIVHRDLKPDNVMVSRNGAVKLMDFGLARNQEVRTLTQMGCAVGTPDYMAPEMLLRGPDRSALTDRSDQYALGILIFEVLTGRRPFDWDDPMKLITMHLTAAPPLIRSVRADVPEAIEAVVSRMLAKDPEARFPSVAEAGEALRAAAL